MNNNPLNNRFTLVLATVLLTAISSCSVFRPGTTSGSCNGAPERPLPDKTAPGDTRFLNTISTENSDMTPGPETNAARKQAVTARNDRSRAEKAPLYRSRDKTSGRDKDPAAEKGVKPNTEPLSVLQLKYSMLTNTPVEKLDNQKLLEFMDEWYGVPYRFGGTTKKGIDCSAFALNLMSDVYGITSLPRISRDQYTASERISRKKLREGDLVFFHTYGKGKTVTHVGVYLYNNRFVHASVSGVQIDDLDGSYYSRHFVGAGRVLE